MKPSFWLSLLATSVLLAPGCAGYRLDSETAAGHRTITVAPFANLTGEPRLTPALATALRRQFQADGTYRLATRRRGDLVVTGTIDQYSRTGLTFDPEDLISPRDFDISMTAQIRVRDVRRQKVVLEQSVTGRTMIRAFDHLADAERQALPLLAENLARQTVDLLTDGTW